MTVIRQEELRDYQLVSQVVEQAFRDVPESDHLESFLVERLRKSEAFLPELSLVAEHGDGKIIGYVLLTKVEIISDDAVIPSLGVAPLAVLPEYQRKGIGGKLLLEAHRRAIRLGYNSAVLLGYKDYYSRFGYRCAADFGIRFPFDAPADCCMVAELCSGALSGVHGCVHYDSAFFE